ncbi:MAG TPA: A24 family peptidase [Candidatus Anaerobutyricum stercoris]|uniref:A24 family peptidase n=1 Tax=Candidatus Anaerobutyricum stercoris TaxID=2838457 RepID=A0A9D2J807_9FIRM|nr:A24 family peptidase [Candidatus Anaerobutyricum stercoris]
MTIAAFFALLGVIAWTDWKTMRIPNRLNAAVFVTGLCAFFTVPGLGVPERVLGMFVVSVPMLLAALLVPGGFGGGDIKLMAAGGLFLGWEGNVLAAVLGIFAGGIWGLYLLLFKRADRRDVFPFGPCLCGGMLAAFVILCTRGSYHIL